MEKLNVLRSVSPPRFRVKVREATPATDMRSDMPATKKVKHADESDAANKDTKRDSLDDTESDCRFCGRMNSRRLYYCQELENFMRSSKAANDRLLRMPTDFQKKPCGVRKYVRSGDQSRRRTKSMKNSKACKTARKLGYRDVVDRYSKCALHTNRVDEHECTMGGRGAQKPHYQYLECREASGRSARSGCSSTTTLEAGTHARITGTTQTRTPMERLSAQMASPARSGRLLDRQPQRMDRQVVVVVAGRSMVI